MIKRKYVEKLVELMVYNKTGLDIKKIEMYENTLSTKK